MVFLNPSAPDLSDMNLLLQIAIFVILVVGFLGAKFRRSFIKHGTVMAIALVLNTISIFAVMIPSLLGIQAVFGDLFTRVALVIGSHAVLGSLVEALGIYLVGTWAFSPHDIKNCVGRKKIMIVTIALWFLELMVGVYIYAMLYLSL
jgi:uncharacterized membrane protein YozB (DUF420 family)